MNKLLLIIAMLMMAGCTTTARMSRQDLVNFKIDCDHRQEQMDFLRSQWPSEKDMWINTFTVTSLTGVIVTSLDGTEKTRREMVDGYYTSQLRGMMDDIRTTCALYDLNQQQRR